MRTIQIDAHTPTGFKHSQLCHTLAAGCEELDIPFSEVKRNCTLDECSTYCALGCKRGGKQDSVRGWLAEACEHGAKILTGSRCCGGLCERTQ